MNITTEDLAVADLVPTQNGLRDDGQLAAMVEFVRRGGYFTVDAQVAFAVATGRVPVARPIRIVRIGRTPYVHDGHHRIVAILRGGRSYLVGDEYESVLRPVGYYAEANLAAGWLTPFDPATECRKADLAHYKAAAMGAYAAGGWQVLSRFVAEGRDLYAEPRRVRTVAELEAACPG